MPKLQREWSLMPPPGAQLVFWADGSLKLKFPADKSRDMLEWAEQMVGVMRTLVAMEEDLAAKQAAEQPEADEQVPALGPPISAAEAMKKGVPSISDHMEKMGIKRQVKAMQQGPKPLQARPMVVNKTPSAEPPIAGRPQGDLPEVPLDAPKDAPSSAVVAPLDMPGPAPQQDAPPDQPGPTEETKTVE